MQAGMRGLLRSKKISKVGEETSGGTGGTLTARSLDGTAGNTTVDGARRGGAGSEVTEGADVGSTWAEVMSERAERASTDTARSV